MNKETKELGWFDQKANEAYEHWLDDNMIAFEVVKDELATNKQLWVLNDMAASLGKILSLPLTKKTASTLISEMKAQLEKFEKQEFDSAVSKVTRLQERKV